MRLIPIHIARDGLSFPKHDFLVYHVTKKVANWDNGENIEIATFISTFVVLLKRYKMSGHTTSYDKVDFLAIMKILAGDPFLKNKKFKIV